VLATVGLAALTWALTIGSSSRGWTPGALTAAVLSIGSLLFYLRVEKRAATARLMPLQLFASRSFVGLTIFTFLLYGALGGLFVLVPYLLIRAAGYSGTAAGAALLPLPLLLTVTSPIAGALAGRIGPRLPLTLGPLIVAAGFLLALRINISANYWVDVLPMILVIAVGMSAAVAPLTTAVLTAVDARHNRPPRRAQQRRGTHRRFARHRIARIRSGGNRQSTLSAFHAGDGDRRGHMRRSFAERLRPCSTQIQSRSSSTQRTIVGRFRSDEALQTSVNKTTAMGGTRQRTNSSRPMRAMPISTGRERPSSKRVVESRRRIQPPPR